MESHLFRYGPSSPWTWIPYRPWARTNPWPSAQGEVLDLTPLFPSAGLFTEWTQGGTRGHPHLGVLPGWLSVRNGGQRGRLFGHCLVMLGEHEPSPGADASFALCPWQTVDLTTVYSLQGLTATYALDGLPVARSTQVGRQWQLRSP